MNTVIDKQFTKLRELKLDYCIGEILSSVLTHAAPYISSLELRGVDMKTLINNPFTNLQVVLGEWNFGKWCLKEIDISESALMTRGGRLEEFGSKVKRTWNEDRNGNRIN